MVSVSATTPEEAAKSLLAHHYAIIKLPDNVLEATNKIMREGLVFFDLNFESKKASASPKILEGYRELGAEKDANTNRPDLSESFAVWFRNATHPEVQSWSQDCLLHRLMSSGLDPYAEFTEDILKAIKREVDPSYADDGKPVVSIRSLSYLQMNFYRPAMHKSDDRDTMMDIHEDGHILTILKPTKPGLRIAPGELIKRPSRDRPVGVFKCADDLLPVNIGEGEALLIPSTPTFYLTGGLIRPLFHKVMKERDDIRQSIMFFVNPTRDIPIAPWMDTDDNLGVNIHSIVDAVSGQYGQAAISEIIRRS